MKQLLMVLLVLTAFTVNAQKAVKGSDGNYYADTTKVSAGVNYKEPDGTTHPLYVTEKGKYYWMKTNPKTGKVTKSYLKLQ